MVDARLLIISHVAVALITYAMIDPRPVDVDVAHDGYFQVTTSRILSATVESLREEAKLQVLSYKGTAKVQTEREWLWLFEGRQSLTVPAVVSYRVDLSDLSLADVTFDENTNVVKVRLPKVTLGEIAFQPENAITTSGGILSWDDDQIEALRKLNFKNAREAMVAQAQQTAFLNAANRQAQSIVTDLFEIPLRAAGRPDVRVVATFD